MAEHEVPGETESNLSERARIATSGYADLLTLEASTDTGRSARTIRLAQSPHETTKMKRRFLVSATDFVPREVECDGCSGDALNLALQDVEIRHWKVSRRSLSGQDWFFEVAVAEETKEFRVQTLQ